MYDIISHKSCFCILCQGKGIVGRVKVWERKENVVSGGGRPFYCF